MADLELTSGKPSTRQTPKTGKQITDLNQVSLSNSNFKHNRQDNSNLSNLLGGILTKQEFESIEKASEKEFTSMILDGVDLQRESDQYQPSHSYWDCDEDVNEPVEDYLEQEKFTKF